MKLDLAQCHTRLATPRDRDDLLRIAKGIWGGSDYLPKVMDRWIAEPWFLVCEYRGKVIACLKMTLFPDKVLWFEGLRVQHRYQNQGVATLMNKQSFLLASQISKEIPGLRYEFCTYYQNVESLHLTQKLGFKVVEKFYVLDKRGIKATLKPEILKLEDLSLFRHYPFHIPCAWQSIHNHPSGLAYLQEHGKLIRTPHNTYFLAGLHEPNITLLEPPNESLKQDLPYLQYLFGSRQKYGIIMPLSFGNNYELLHKLGFRFWDGEIEENMLVLSM